MNKPSFRTSYEITSNDELFLVNNIVSMEASLDVLEIEASDISHRVQNAQISQLDGEADEDV